MFKIILAVFYATALFLNSSLASLPPKTVNDQLQVSSSSIRFAKAFSAISESLNNGKISQKDANFLYRLSKRDRLFKIKKISHIVKKLSRVKNNATQLARVCNSIRPRKNPYSSILEKDIRHFCMRRITFNLSGGKTINTFTPALKEYFKRNIDYQLANSPDYLIRTLENINPNSFAFTFFKDLLISSAISNDISPNHRLLSIIGTGKSYTRHVQESSLLDKRGKWVFQKEIKNMSREIQGLISKDYPTSKLKLQELMQFVSSNKNFLSFNRTSRAFIQIGNSLIRKKHFLRARKTFEFAYKQLYPAKKNDLLFLRLWSFVLEGSPDKLILEAQKLHLFEKFDTLTPKIQYWISNSLLKNKNYKFAKFYYQKLFNSHPFNFYSIMSYHDLKTMDFYKIEDPFKKRTNLNIKSTGKIKNNKIFRRHLLVYQAFQKTKITRFKNYALTQILHTSSQFPDDLPEFYVFLAKFLNGKREFLDSFKTLNYAIRSGHLEYNHKFLKMLFPRPYLNKIKTFSENIDPHLVLSIIRQESAFNPKAKSSVGARGLMQLMPRTARGLAQIKKTKHLENPNLNLKLGIKYFKKLLVKFDGNLMHSLAAYNAGQGNLKKWNKNILTYDDFLVNIENIPFKETRDYIKYIYRNYFFYKYISGKDDLLNERLNETFVLNIKH